jgi:hypothetical protein
MEAMPELWPIAATARRRGRETPPVAAAARAVGASKIPRAFLCNFTSTPFIRTRVCKNILELDTRKVKRSCFACIANFSRYIVSLALQIFRDREPDTRKVKRYIVSLALQIFRDREPDTRNIAPHTHATFYKP